MALFNFGKKKETETCCTEQERKTCCPETETKTTCACGEIGGKSDVKNARFIVLGACCKKSADTFENTKTAVREMGFDDEVINIGDNVEIARFGVMQTPALVINSKVVAYGRLLSVEDVKKLIEKTL